MAFNTESRSGATIVEAMIVLVIVTIGLVGTYELLHGGVKLASSTESRIQAINLAREGIEAVENIRNTNWIKFSSDFENCFDVADYDQGCIGNPSAPKITSGTPSVLLNQNGEWRLSAFTSSGVAYDDRGLSVQYPGALPALDPCQSKRPTGCMTKYFRTVTVSDESIVGMKRMRIRSLVTWRDASRSAPYQIELEHVLTNWKPNF